MSGLNGGNGGSISEEVLVSQESSSSDVSRNSDGFQGDSGVKEGIDSRGVVGEGVDGIGVSTSINRGSSSTAQSRFQGSNVGSLLSSNELDVRILGGRNSSGKEGALGDVVDSVGIKGGLEVFKSEGILQHIVVVGLGSSLVEDSLVVAADISEGCSVGKSDNESQRRTVGVDESGSN